MGYIYKLAKTGSRSRFWWLCWKDSNGRRVQESSKCEREKDAKKKLRTKEAAVDRGEPITKETGRIKLKDALQTVVDKLTNDNRSSTEDAKRRIEHLNGFFGDRLLTSVGVAQGRAYATHRLAQRAANASVNRELSLLRRAFRLAAADKDVLFVPKFEFLKEPKPRAGFVERRQLDAIVSRLPPWLRPALTAMYILGWRRREVLGLGVDQIDLVANTVTLDAEQSKTGEQRTVVMTDELRTLVKRQLASVKKVQKKENKVDVPLFHRPSGRPIGSFRKRWLKACKAAGYAGASDTRPGVLLHDFRRSAARNITRSGTPEQVAMKLLGHKSPSTFRRYRITDEQDLHTAADRLERFFAEQKRVTKKTLGRVREFKRVAAAKAG